MVDIKKDKRGVLWTITRTDADGYHRQLALTEDELNELTRLWTETINIK